MIELPGIVEELRFWAIMLLIGLGLFFTFVSAVGVIRLPDVYSRAHTASQTDTLGAGMALAAVALALGWQNATVYTVLLLFFVFITNPTAAHAIARSASESGIDPWMPETEADAGVGSQDTEGAAEQYEEREDGAENATSDSVETESGSSDATDEATDETDADRGGDGR